jgi:hypothetical protein
MQSTATNTMNLSNRSCTGNGTEASKFAPFFSFVFHPKVEEGFKVSFYGFFEVETEGAHNVWWAGARSPSRRRGRWNLL